MPGEEGQVCVDMTETSKAIRIKEAEGQFLKSKGGTEYEIDEEEEKDLNAPSSESVVHIKSEVNTSNDGKEIQEIKKGILKHERTYSNKHVDFNMDVEFVPFDESKDYTIEIKIVDQMPKKIISYAALFAQQKALEEQERVEKEREEKQTNLSSKKHCVTCKSKKVKKFKEDICSTTTSKKDETNNMAQEKDDKMEKKVTDSSLNECVPMECMEDPSETTQDCRELCDVVEKTLSGVHCEEERQDAETCDCQNEEGEHNEDKCDDCQSYQQEIAESQISRKYINEDLCIQSKTDKQGADEMYSKVNENSVQIINGNMKTESIEPNERKRSNEDAITVNQNKAEKLSNKGVSSNLMENVIDIQIDNLENSYDLNEDQKASNVEKENRTQFEDAKQNSNEILTGETGINASKGNTHTIQTACVEALPSLNLNDVQNLRAVQEVSKKEDIVVHSTIPEKVKNHSNDVQLIDSLSNLVHNADNSAIRLNEVCPLSDHQQDKEQNQPARNEFTEINNNQQVGSKNSFAGSNYSFKEVGEKLVEPVKLNNPLTEKEQMKESLQSSTENNEKSDRLLELDVPVAENEKFDSNMQNCSEVCGSELDKGDFFANNDSKLVENIKKATPFEEQQECTNLLENYSEPGNGDEPFKNKLDENNIQKETKICKVEREISSGREINNSR